MDYKSVIEEQIKELQKVQVFAVESSSPETACEVAKTITELCKVASCY